MRSQRTLISYGAAATLAVCGVLACASDEKKDPDLDPANNVTADADAGDLTSNSDDQDETPSQQKQQGQDQEGASQNNAVNEEYDDDWNDIGSQEPKPEVAEQEQEQQQIVEEPPLNNNLVEEPVAEEPPPEPIAEVPLEEPPLDVEPAPVADAPPPPPPAPAMDQPVVTGPPLLKPDIMPVKAQLTWVGYDYVERDGIVRLEMVTRGTPRFNIFQERNQSDQPELVVRFFETELRQKLRRDIDASEFRSPVAFVRLRPDPAEDHTDVVITLRDAIQPRMYAHAGNVLLSFPLPDHYFGNSTIGNAPVAKAEIIPNSNLMPLVDNGSDLPEGMKLAKAFVTDPGADAFKNAPIDGGAPVETTAGAVENEMPPVDAGVNNVLPPVNDFGSNGSQDLVGDLNMLPANGNASNFSDFDGEPAAGGDEGLVPDNMNSENFQENGAQSEQGNDAEGEALDGNSFDDDDSDDDSNGNSESNIDKFDVRHAPARAFRHFARILPLGRLGGLIALLRASTAFGQNNDFGSDNEFGSGNNNIGNGNGNSGSNNFGNGNSGSNNFGNGNSGSNNFGNGNNGANNMGDLAGQNNLGNAAGANNLGQSSNGLGTTNNAGAGNVNSMSAFGNGASNAAPANAQAMPNTAPVNPTPANTVVEPAAVDGNPDLAGEESVGADSETEAQESAGGRSIRLDFRGAPLTEVIRALGDESGVNFIFPPEVGQKPVFVNLNGVPFNDALKAVLEANSLGMVPVGPNIVRIDTLEKLAADKKAEEERKAAAIKLQPTKVLVHRLSYGKADEAKAMLADLLGHAASEDKRVTVQVDARSNAVIIHAPANELAMVKALLERIDLETPQVRIASRIVEAKKTFSDAFGLSWSTPFNVDQGRGLGFGNLVFPNSMLSRYSVDAGGLNQRVGNFGFRFGSLNNSLALDVALSMQEERNNIQLLQSGNLIVEDNVEAEIVAGSSDFFRQPVVAGGGAAGEAGFDEVTYNLSMKVKPHITADGAVQMQLTISSDTPSQASAAGASASKNNRKITTSLLRRNGETAVIGGIYNTSIDKKDTGVPWLSSIPIIGALFRQRTTQEEKRELMVLVTPTILNAPKGESAVRDTFDTVASNVGSEPIGADDQGEDDIDLGNDDANFGNNQGNGGQNAGFGNGNNAGFGNVQNGNGQEAANQSNSGNGNAGDQGSGENSGNPNNAAEFEEE